MRIVEEETQRFMAEFNLRATAPVIKQLRDGWQEPKEQELRRLLNKLPQLDEKSREEIARSFDRLIKKLLHPPVESLRDEARQAIETSMRTAPAPEALPTARTPSTGQSGTRPITRA